MTKVPTVSVRILMLMAALILGALSAGAQDAKSGSDLFVKYTCYGSHGFSGQNGPGMRLVPMRMTQEDFTRRVRTPANARQMPPYSAKVITDAQLGDVWAYIKTLPDSPAAKDIPLLQQILTEKK